MEKLTFEQLPEAVALLLEKVSRIERLLIKSPDGNVEIDQMLPADKAAEYLHVSMSMLYKMTHRNDVPCYKPGGKKLYFKVSELNGIKTGSVKNL